MAKRKRKSGSMAPKAGVGNHNSKACGGKIKIKK